MRRVRSFPQRVMDVLRGELSSHANKVSISSSNPKSVGIRRQSSRRLGSHSAFTYHGALAYLFQTLLKQIVHTATGAGSRFCSLSVSQENELDTGWLPSLSPGPTTTAGVLQSSSICIVL
jgi:hypothetical protein